MTTKSELADIQTARVAIDMRTKALGDRLPDLHASLSTAQAEMTRLRADDDSARAALADALKAGDPDALAKARRRATKALEALAGSAAIGNEVQALQSALDGVNAELMKLGRQDAELLTRERALVLPALDAMAETLPGEQRELLERLGALVARSAALSHLSTNYGGEPCRYGPRLPPVVDMDALGPNRLGKPSVRVVPSDHFAPAMADAMQRLRDDGFRI